jgi:2-keto-4-pentenoate hydratase
VLQSAATIDEIAHQFVSARKAARPLVAYPGTLPGDLATAYAVQDEAISLYDGAICGWKVGRIHPPLATELGTTRLFGPAWVDALETMTFADQPVGRIFSGGFGAVEAEFMYRIGSTPAADKCSFSLEDTAALIDTVFVGFEIASSPFSDINRLGPLVTISDFGNNNGLLVGPEIADWQHSGHEQWLVETRIDGEIAGTGRAADFPDGPLGSVRLLIENLVARGHVISEGLLVSTGAVTGVHEVRPGQHVEARFGTLPAISCRIEHATA